MSEPKPCVTATGCVIASFGRRALVETKNGKIVSCVTRGRRSDIVCGDIVSVNATADGEGVIEAVEQRTSLVYRSDAKRDKAIAANATQVAVVLAVSPAPNVDFLDRCLAAAEFASLRILLVLNKIDLGFSGSTAAGVVDEYRALGYTLVTTSRTTSVAPLLAELHGYTSVFVGQSGVGKSTLVNRLVPGASARVGETSALRDAGRHTTTHAQMYRIDAQTGLIDSPGMHAFGLSHVPPADLASCFVEMRPLLGQCRFSNCRHADEPGCAIAEAAQQYKVSPLRLASYRRILETIGRGRSSG